MKWYKELQDAAAQCAQSFQQLNVPKDSQVGSNALCLQIILRDYCRKHFSLSKYPFHSPPVGFRQRN